MIEFSLKYSPLFRVCFEHEYFQDKALRYYSLIPTNETIANLQRLNFLLKNTKNGVDILADSLSNEKLLLKLKDIEEENISFSLLLYCTDSNFKNYTEIPYDTNGKILHFSNNALKTKKEGVLSKSAEVTIDDLYNLNQIATDSKNETLTVSKQFGEKQELNYTIENNNFEPLNNLPTGFYKVFAGKKELSGFVSMREKHKGQAIGMITIELNKTILSKITDDINNGDVPMFTYTIKFSARSIFWKYSIVPGYIKKIDDVAVINTSSDKSQKFKAIKGATNAENPNIVSFESALPIKFQELYDFSFQLKKGENQAGSKTLVKKLPYAAIDFIKPKNETQFYSEIFVYV